MKARRHLVAVDIGGSKISLLARDEKSDADVYADKIKTPAAGGVSAVVQALDAEIDAIPGGREAMKALGVAVPGHVRPDGHVLRAGNLEGWFDVPLRTMLEERYRVPVFVEGDANCGALGEKWLGAAIGLDNFVFLALGTGVGAGLFLRGEIYRGSHDAGGEAGDMVFNEARPKTVAKAVGKRVIKKNVKRVTGEKMSAADALAKAPRNPELARATKEVVESLSATVVAISALLDPQAILFGGGTSNAGEALLRRVRRRVARVSDRQTRLALAGLGSDSQLYGALWGAVQVARSGRRR